MEWIEIKKQDPPDEFVEVMDDRGNVGTAVPTYYPFRVEKRPGDERKPWGWRGTAVPCEDYWDGGWMIDCEGLECPITGEITHWRKLSSEQNPERSVATEAQSGNQKPKNK